MRRKIPETGSIAELNAMVGDLQKRAKAVLFVGNARHLANLFKAVTTSIRGINGFKGPSDRLKPLVDALISRLVLFQEEIEAREQIVQRSGIRAASRQSSRRRKENEHDSSTR